MQNYGFNLTAISSLKLTLELLVLILFIILLIIYSPGYNSLITEKLKFVANHINNFQLNISQKYRCNISLEISLYAFNFNVIDPNHSKYKISFSTAILVINILVYKRVTWECTQRTILYFLYIVIIIILNKRIESTIFLVVCSY